MRWDRRARASILGEDPVHEAAAIFETGTHQAELLDEPPDQRGHVVVELRGILGAPAGQGQTFGPVVALGALLGARHFPLFLIEEREPPVGAVFEVGLKFREFHLRVQDVAALFDVGEGGLDSGPQAAGPVGNADLEVQPLVFAFVLQGRPPGDFIAAGSGFEQVEEIGHGFDAREDGNPLGEDLIVGPFADRAEGLGVVDLLGDLRGLSQDVDHHPLADRLLGDRLDVFDDPADGAVAV